MRQSRDRFLSQYDLSTSIWLKYVQKRWLLPLRKERGMQRKSAVFLHWTTSIGLDVLHLWCRRRTPLLSITRVFLLRCCILQIEIYQQYQIWRYLVDWYRMIYYGWWNKARLFLGIGHIWLLDNFRWSFLRKIVTVRQRVLLNILAVSILSSK